MITMITLKYLVLRLTYLGFGLGYLPGLRMNRVPIAIVGSAFVVAEIRTRQCRVLQSLLWSKRQGVAR